LQVDLVESRTCGDNKPQRWQQPYSAGGERQGFYNKRDYRSVWERADLVFLKLLIFFKKKFVIFFIILIYIKNNFLKKNIFELTCKLHNKKILFKLTNIF
jgi:hypothetical protein